MIKTLKLGKIKESGVSVKYIVNIFREVCVPVEVEAENILDAWEHAKITSTRTLVSLLQKNRIITFPGSTNADFTTPAGTSPVIEGELLQDTADMRWMVDSTHFPKDIDIMTGFAIKPEPEQIKGIYKK